MDETPLDWIAGDPETLRRWRETRPEVLAPILPADVTLSLLPPEGACPGGLVFTPPDPKATGIVYFHGGSFMVGSPETHRVHCAWIAHLTGCTTFSIRYRLAPEHVLPAQAEDAVGAIRRQLRHHSALRLMGDSAGGLVALWGHAGLTEEERGAIHDLTLFYPVAGLPLEPSPEDASRESNGLGPKAIASMYHRADPDERMKGDARYDPLTADFPKPQRLIVLGAAKDPVYQDSLALYHHLSAILIIAEGQEHSFLCALPEAKSKEYLAQALSAAGFPLR